MKINIKSFRKLVKKRKIIKKQNIREQVLTLMWYCAVYASDTRDKFDKYWEGIEPTIKADLRKIIK